MRRAKPSPADHLPFAHNRRSGTPDAHDFTRRSNLSRPGWGATRAHRRWRIVFSPRWHWAMTSCQAGRIQTMT